MRAAVEPSWRTPTSAGSRTSFIVEPPDEVDFWQPSPHGFKAIPPGAPFFFRLGKPHLAIAGFGFFARYERVPVWLAWESFGDLNGTDTFAEMTARIEAIRRRTGSALLTRPQDYEVGCIMISQPSDAMSMLRREKLARTLFRVAVSSLEMTEAVA